MFPHSCACFIPLYFQNTDLFGTHLNLLHYQVASSQLKGYLSVVGNFPKNISMCIMMIGGRITTETFECVQQAFPKMEQSMQGIDFQAISELVLGKGQSNSQPPQHVHRCRVCLQPQCILKHSKLKFVRSGHHLQGLDFGLLLQHGDTICIA
jgi:hypothetical protein